MAKTFSLSKSLVKYRLKDGIYWHRLYFDLVPKWMKRYGPPLGGYNYATYLYQPHVYLQELLNETRWFIQRGRRGYSDRDVWSLDFYLTSWMPQALETLRREHNGYPPGVRDNHQWNIELAQIINAFKMARKIQTGEIKQRKDRIKAYKQFRQEMKIFTQRFFDLWD